MELCNDLGLLCSAREKHGKGYLPIRDRVISSASGTERGEVFYGPTDWLGSRDPMTHIRYTRGSRTGLADRDSYCTND